MITAKLTNYRISPRKVRLVADAMRGKKVETAINELPFMMKKASAPLLKLLQSAVANGKNNHNIDKDNLFIKEIRVDGGIVLKRSMPRARGSAYPIRKRTSHVLITLAEKIDKKTVKKTKK